VAAIEATPNAEGLVIERVEVATCRNGFARVFATPRPSPSLVNTQTEQFFLRYTGGRWEVVTYGTGVSCQDPDLRPPELEELCRGLGERA
jgi:hypothetical protein